MSAIPLLRARAVPSEKSFLAGVNKLDLMLASILMGPLAILAVGGRTPSLFWIDVVIAVLAAVAFAKVLAKPRTETFRVPRAMMWALGYVVLCASSLLLTQDILAGIAILKLRLMPVAVFFLSFRLVQTRADLEHFFKALVWFGFALAAISLYHWYQFSTGKLVLSDEYGAKDMLQLSFGRSNYLASMFIVLIPVMLAFVRERRKSPTFIPYAVALLLVFLALVFAQSRGGLISFALGLIAWALFAAARAFSLKTVFKGLGAALLIISIAIFIWFKIPEEVRSDLSLTFGLLFADFSQGNYGGGRTELWLAALKGAWQSDLFGIGLGNELLFYSQEQMTPWAHNLYLETLLETGLVGLILLMGVIVAFWKTCWRIWKSAPIADRPFAGAILTALVICLINNAQEPSFWGPQYSCLLWMMMGVAYAWYRMLGRSAPASADSSD